MDMLMFRLYFLFDGLTFDRVITFTVIKNVILILIQPASKYFSITFYFFMYLLWRVPDGVCDAIMFYNLKLSEKKVPIRIKVIATCKTHMYRFLCVSVFKQQ